ncbi:hypothetical protein DER46DRAFT_666249 [Fusarium sp. MPI-SDFR-AT-0072]|nr:hypothetical protein DER46DRAFT_666249 [Fusarium sp. MPI-SDFR-AT-0072]
MQLSKVFINAAFFIGAISAAAVPDTKIPGIDLTKRACNEEQFRQCTRNCPTGTGGGPIGCPIGCCIAAGCC